MSHFKITCSVLQVIYHFDSFCPSLGDFAFGLLCCSASFVITWYRHIAFWSHSLSCSFTNETDMLLFCLSLHSSEPAGSGQEIAKGRRTHTTAEAYRQGSRASTRQSVYSRPNKIVCARRAKDFNRKSHWQLPLLWLCSFEERFRNIFLEAWEVLKWKWRIVGYQRHICGSRKGWFLFNPLWSLKSGFSSPWNLHDIATVATWMNLTWNSLRGVRSDSHHPETSDWSAESTGGHYGSKWVSTKGFHICSYVSCLQKICVRFQDS